MGILRNILTLGEIWLFAILPRVYRNVIFSLDYSDMSKLCLA